VSSAADPPRTTSTPAVRGLRAGVNLGRLARPTRGAKAATAAPATPSSRRVLGRGSSAYDQYACGPRPTGRR